MKSVFLFAGFFALQFGVFGQSNSLQFSNAQLNADLDYLVKSIAETHPNPFTVISKAEFSKNVEHVRSQFGAGLDYRGFYKLVAPLVASISDGHTAVNFPGRK